MRPGTIPLTFLGLAFAALQVWWITMTIKNGRKTLNKNNLVLDHNKDKLAEQKKVLEKLFKK